ncbi:MAG TPA: hypothetical protein VIZ86_14270 [Pseudomonas sp.]
MSHLEAIPRSTAAIANEALQLSDASSEVISQLRTLLRTVQPQLAVGSAAHDLAKIARSLAEDWQVELEERTTRLRDELGAQPAPLAADALCATPAI